MFVSDQESLNNRKEIMTLRENTLGLVEKLMKEHLEMENQRVQES